MGSTAITLIENDPPAHTLALVVAIAVRAALFQAARGMADFVIKWPNDILIGDAKLAGILLEREANHLIVGVGVNIGIAPELPDRKATSLAAAGITISRNEFTELLTAIWPSYIHKWRSDGIAAIIEEWMAYAHPLGTQLRVSEAENAGLTGAFDGLETNGALRLQMMDGSRIIINAGDVALRD